MSILIRLDHNSIIPPPPPPPPTLNSFSLPLLIRNYMLHILKNLLSWPFSSHLIFAFLPTILPNLVNLFNFSLLSSIVPAHFKSSEICPFLKNNLGPSDPTNHKTISSLPFFSNTETLSLCQLSNHWLIKLRLTSPIQRYERPQKWNYLTKCY